MSYKINLEAYSSIYALPSSVVDKHIKLSGAIQLKVLLLCLKNPADIDEQEIAKFLSVPVPDVVDALNYWADLGVISNDAESTVAIEIKPQKAEEKPIKKIVPTAAVKPTREEVAKRGEESKEVARLLREAQMRLSRPLSPSEASTLVWLFDHEGIDSMVILMLIGFAISEGKPNVGFVEKMAISWINDGALTTKDVEKKIRHIYEMRSAWGVVERAMGIPHRMPSKREQELAYLWVCEYQYTPDILRKAYDACVDATSDFSIPYIKKILERWYKAGIRSGIDLAKYLESESNSTSKKTDKKETFDVDQFNKALNQLPE